jgi:hypothetical protein
MKGDKTRVTDRTSYENNWNTIFGKKDTNTPAVEEMIERANHKFPGTLGALAQLESDESEKRMREWAIMMDFLRTLKYEEYPIEAAEELYNSFK